MLKPGGVIPRKECAIHPEPQSGGMCSHSIGADSIEKQKTRLDLTLTLFITNISGVLIVLMLNEVVLVLVIEAPDHSITSTSTALRTEHEHEIRGFYGMRARKMWVMARALASGSRLIESPAQPDASAFGSLIVVTFWAAPPSTRLARGRTRSVRLRGVPAAGSSWPG